MKYLYIDTSSNTLSIAILNDNDILAECSSYNKYDHSRNALAEIDKVFNNSGIKPNDIDKLIVVNGPGSFTGIRIGVTIAKIFGWSLDKTIIPVSSLKGQALSIMEDADYYVSVIDARRDSVYAGIYNNRYENIISESYMTINELNKIINNLEGRIMVTGNIEINNQFKTIPVSFNISKIVAYYKNNNGLNAHEFKPNYLKRVEAEERLVG